jgi:hypothetical protein
MTGPSIHTAISRDYDGVRVEVDQERSLARIDIGQLPSWDLVGLVERRLAPAVVGCAVIEVIGEDTRALDYLVSELDKLLPHIEGWLHPSSDSRRGAA